MFLGQVPYLEISNKIQVRKKRLQKHVLRARMTAISAALSVVSGAAGFGDNGVVKPVREP